jgi:hypothetical protein
MIPWTAITPEDTLVVYFHNQKSYKQVAIGKDGQVYETDLNAFSYSAVVPGWAEYEEIAAADPLNFNTEQMYEDLIAERQLAELLEAQAGMNEWWLIALPEERQAWLDRARQLQMKGK